jgi:hypothetical protein
MVLVYEYPSGVCIRHKEVITMCPDNTEPRLPQNDLERTFPGLIVVGRCDGKTCEHNKPCIPKSDSITVLRFETYYPSKDAWVSFLHLVESLFAESKEFAKLKGKSQGHVNVHVAKFRTTDLMIVITWQNIIPDRDFDGTRKDYPMCPFDETS